MATEFAICYFFFAGIRNNIFKSEPKILKAILDFLDSKQKQNTLPLGEKTLKAHTVCTTTRHELIRHNFVENTSTQYPFIPHNFFLAVINVSFENTAAVILWFKRDLFLF